jgi:peptidyl-prolyl cis-trans isomerase SurA
MVFTLFAALALTVGSSTSAHAGTLIDRLEASVNSSLILHSDIDQFRRTERLRSQLDPLFAGTTVASKGAAATDAEIVSFLIDERLITQQFPVSDSDAEQEVNTIQSNNHIDREQLKRALKDQGFSYDEYFELIRSSASKRNLIDRDIRTKVTISDDDVKNYFYNHYSRSENAPKAYRLAIITIATRNYKNPGAAKETAARALADIKGGESFDEVAKRMSDDGSASGGGDLGELTDDQLSPVIRDQVKKMKIGEISPVFGSQGSGAFMIVRLLDVRSADTDKLDRMKDEIRNQLSAGEYQHQIALWIERQKQTAFLHRAGEPSFVGIPTTASK